MHVNSNHSTHSLTWKPLQEKTTNIIFINVYRNQTTVINIVGTNLLETPISSIEHQLNKIWCRHQPIGDTNLLS
jgi:hypothetical protein